MLSSLDFNERAELHGDLRVIARALEAAMVAVDLPTATVRDLLAEYERLWNHHVAFTGEVFRFAGQLLPRGALGTLKTDLEDRPRERLDAKPAYLSLTIPEWLDALSSLGDEPEWP